MLNENEVYLYNTSIYTDDEVILYIWLSGGILHIEHWNLIDMKKDFAMIKELLSRPLTKVICIKEIPSSPK